MKCFKLQIYDVFSSRPRGVQANSSGIRILKNFENYGRPLTLKFTMANQSVDLYLPDVEQQCSAPISDFTFIVFNGSSLESHGHACMSGEHMTKTATARNKATKGSSTITDVSFQMNGVRLALDPLPLQTNTHWNIHNNKCGRAW